MTYSLKVYLPTDLESVTSLVVFFVAGLMAQGLVFGLGSGFEVYGVLFRYWGFGLTVPDLE